MKFDFRSLGGTFDGVFIALFSVSVDRTGTGSNGKLHVLPERDYVANGISAVSGMLLNMKSFVRGNPDKEGSMAGGNQIATEPSGPAHSPWLRESIDPFARQNE